MDTLDQLDNHIVTVTLLEQLLRSEWEHEQFAIVSDEKRIRLLVTYALSQQPNYGRDVSVATLSPLLKHLREPATLVAYAIDSFASNSYRRTEMDDDDSFYFCLEYATDEGDIELRAVADVGAMDLSWDPTVLTRAFIQENHSMVFTLATKTRAEPIHPPVVWHAITGSPRVRMFNRIAGQPNALGQIPVFQEYISSNKSVAVSVYADCLTDYIKAATNYHQAMILYQGVAGATTIANDHSVLEAYEAFAKAKHLLLWVDNFAGHNQWLHIGLRELHSRRTLPIESRLCSWWSAACVYITNTGSFVVLPLIYILVSALYIEIM